jgi:MinD-like ATPase involved in chromosome partitioning or flagellar assembly
VSLAWGEVLETLIRLVEAWPGRIGLKRVCVVRDLHGRIRLAMQATEGSAPDTADLEREIAANLGSWFAGPILWTGAPSTQEQRRLAQNLLGKLQNQWPAGWPKERKDVTGVKAPITVGAQGLWCGEQRARTKDIWIQEGPVEPPWPLHARTPAIVSFYSFKGGVGRTTTLGIVARQLARAGRHIVAIDLDLEAPGLGRFFGVETERGVLDLLTEHAATGTIDLGSPGLYSAEIEEGQGKITIYPVGPVDWSYVERLACLDYAPRARATISAVETALRAILEDVKRRLKPDYIFLDARAGLHDLGGLSLHALAHVDVVVGRAGRATLDGFQIVFDALGRRRHEQDLRVIVVQSFVPLPVTSDDHARIRDNWASALYEAFTATLYDRMYMQRGDDLPEVSDNLAMHYPWVIPQYDSLGRIDRIQDIDRAVLDSESFTALSARIVERCGRSPLTSTDDTDEEAGHGSEVAE